MPQSLALLLFYAGAPAIITNGLVGIGALGFLGAAVQLGLSVGLSALASSLYRPKQPKPEDVQQSYRQATAPRVRHYGRVKTSGPWVFAEAESGNFHKVLALGQGPIDGIEEYWIDDHQVTLAPGGGVQQEPWYDGGDYKVIIQTRRGLPIETAYGSLTATFPEWTAAHRGDGVASLYAKQFASEDSVYLSRFPNGINTNYRVVLRGAIIQNPLTGVVAWDDRAASVIRDYMSHADGMRLPHSIFTTPLAQAGWEQAYIRSNEPIGLKGGGTEPRYRLWGSYQLDERPADVLGRMLAACDGRLIPTPDGGLTLDIGKWQEPTVIIGPDAITGFSDLGRGRNIMETANTIRATFLDPTQDYQATDADPWVDADDVLERGEISKDVQFNMAPSHSQARRLMKLEAYRANPSWVANFQCNLRGLAAFGERFVRIQYPAFGINSVFEVQDFRFVIGEGNILQGVTIQVQSMPQAAYSWDPAQEEGDAPESDESEVDDSIPVPAAPDVNLLPGPVAELTFSPSPSILLRYLVRYKKTADTEWTTVGPLSQDAETYTTPTLAATTQYEFQMALRTEKGRVGTWGPSATATTP